MAPAGTASSQALICVGGKEDRAGWSILTTVEPMTSSLNRGWLNVTKGLGAGRLSSFLVQPPENAAPQNVIRYNDRVKVCATYAALTAQATPKMGRTSPVLVEWYIHSLDDFQIGFSVDLI